MLFADIGLSVLALGVCVATLLPLVRSHRWWIRAWDFPRVLIAIAAAFVVFLCLLAKTPVSLVCGCIAGACLGWQWIKIYPLTPLARREVELVPVRQTGSQVSVFSANVEMTNDRYRDVAAAIDEADPDILFLMETDAVWQEALAAQISRYPRAVHEIRDNYYGMIFATRLDVLRAEIVYLTQDDTPTVFAELKSRDGRKFRFVGLHPRPPVPGNTTKDRDAEVLYAARFARAHDIPLVAVGDFNDAAWSRSSRTFKRVGAYLDPRVGRGFYASFDAKRCWVNVPIDQLYVTSDIAVAAFHVGPHVGSDHLPLIARIELDPEIARAANRAPITIPPKDRQEMERIVETYRRQLDTPFRDTETGL